MSVKLTNEHLEKIQNLCVQNQIKWTGNLTRMGSDGRIVALILKTIYPKFVDLNNYPPQSSIKQKLSNWETLNYKLLVKLGLTQSKFELDNMARGTPGYIEVLLFKIMKLCPKGKSLFTYQGNILPEHEGVVIVHVDKTIGDIQCKIPQKMIQFSNFEKVREKVKDTERKLGKIQQKIAHLENLILLKTEIEDDLCTELKMLKKET